MKKNKIFGIGIASLGVVFSIATAAALYVKSAQDTGFGIGAGEYVGSEGVVTYKINGNTSGSLAPSYLKTDGSNGGTGLGGDYTQVKYEALLSATYAQDLSAQDVVVGNLSVSIKNIPTKYQGKLSIWVGIDGYKEFDGATQESDKIPSLGKQLFATAFMTSDYAITSENSEYVANRDIAVKSGGEQKLVIYMKYDLTGTDLLTQNEASLGYTLDISWGKPSANYNYAYVVGDGNQWTQDDEFAMAPNIDKKSTEGYEWMYNNLKGTLGHAKCNKTENQVTTWSADPDAELDAAKTYNVYWNGSNDTAASFAAIQ